MLFTPYIASFLVSKDSTVEVLKPNVLKPLYGLTLSIVNGLISARAKSMESRFWLAGPVYLQIILH